MALVSLLRYAAPIWWSRHNVLIQNTAPDDYAVANQGQPINIAKAATAEMNAKLTNGAGEESHNRVNSWSTPSGQTNDFAPIDLGQLKKVAQPFYDRLIALGITDCYPWPSSPNLSDDFGVADIGQVKNLFSLKFTKCAIKGLPSLCGVSDSDVLAFAALSAFSFLVSCPAYPSKAQKRIPAP